MLSAKSRYQYYLTNCEEGCATARRTNTVLFCQICDMYTGHKLTVIYSDNYAEILESFSDNIKILLLLKEN